MTELVDIDFSIEEDALIQGLLGSRNKRVEVTAFGIIYAGNLEEVNIDSGIIVVSDEEDKATIEIERIEAFTVAIP